VSGYAYFTESKVTTATKTATVTSATTTTTTSATSSSGLYRVRKSWSDASSQVGAYSVLANATKKCDEVGNTVYTVYDNSGNAVYGAGLTTSTATTTTTKNKTTAGYELTVKNIPFYSSSNGASLGVRSGTFYVWSSEVINGRIRVTKSRGLVGVKSSVTCWLAVKDYE